ncbi:MAG: DUF3842 family protein [Solobacterium sp.]|nr:DUF3842 family protein [Solobacterium sp.]
MEVLVKILVIDAQGGGIGRQLITALKHRFPEHIVLAVGTNSLATSAMLKAGADQAATGENSVVVACSMADLIIGPVGIVIADAMLGEITPKMAAAVGQSHARKILIPFKNDSHLIVGVPDFNVGRLVEAAVETAAEMLGQPA